VSDIKTMVENGKLGTHEMVAKTSSIRARTLIPFPKKVLIYIERADNLPNVHMLRGTRLSIKVMLHFGEQVYARETQPKEKTTSPVFQERFEFQFDWPEAMHRSNLNDGKIAEESSLYLYAMDRDKAIGKRRIAFSAISCPWAGILTFAPGEGVTGPAGRVTVIVDVR